MRGAGRFTPTVYTAYTQDRIHWQLSVDDTLTITRRRHSWSRNIGGKNFSYVVLTLVACAVLSV